MYAPSFIFALAPDFSFIVLVAAAAGIILLAMLFITALDIGDDPIPTVTGDTRVVERERVLVVCPYCGTNNDQGISKCTNCDGEL